LRRQFYGGYGFQGSLSKVVKALLIANVVLYLLQLISTKLGAPIHLLYLTPRAISSGAIWQPFTYMFFHDPSSIFHLLFNMLILWMIGTELEMVWGQSFFARYYFTCGVGAGLFYYLVALTFLRDSSAYFQPMLGASGAIYGLLLAYGVFFSERELLFMMLFPIKAKYFVIILGAVELVSTVFSPSGGVANAAHLGGLVVGFLILFGLGFLKKRRVKQKPSLMGGSPGPRPSKRASKHLKLIISEDPLENFEDDSKPSSSSDGDGQGNPPTWH